MREGGNGESDHNLDVAEADRFHKNPIRSYSLRAALFPTVTHSRIRVAPA